MNVEPAYHGWPLKGSELSQRSRKHMKGGTGPGFLQMYRYVLDSPQWAELPPASVKLLLELARQYKGRNNGNLSVTFEGLKTRGWSSEGTVWKHLRLLEDRGWIVKTRQGGRHIGCNLYGITWEPIDDCNGAHDYPPEHKASHLWKNKIGTTKIGVRSIRKSECESVELRKTEGYIVPLRPVA